MTTIANQAQRAEHFRALHHGDSILVLPNAWDVASARIFAGCGARAVGTTSMGVAAVAGLPDKQCLALDDMLASVSSIAQAIDVPVNADMETGYGDDVQGVVAAIRRTVETGAVGINLEDRSDDPAAPLVETAVHAERVAAIRRLGETLGVPLVINARTDVFLAKVGQEGGRLAHAIERGQAYADAGADCIFVPGGLSRESIRELARELPVALNVIANPATSKPVVPTIPELEQLGVARVSIGSGALRTILAVTHRIAHDLLTAGHYDTMRHELAAPEAADAYAMAIANRP